MKVPELATEDLIPHQMLLTFQPIQRNFEKIMEAFKDSRKKSSFIRDLVIDLVSKDQNWEEEKQRGGDELEDIRQSVWDVAMDLDDYKRDVPELLEKKAD